MGWEFNEPNKSFLDGYLINLFDEFKKHQEKNWDLVMVVDGIEGAGKSKFARQLAWYCDKTFKGEEGLKRICFDPLDFKKQVQDDSNRGKAVIFDEAFRGLSSRSAMSDLNKVLTSLLMECRQRNMFIFLVLPSFYELDRYSCVFRAIGLVHVYVADEWERGYYSYYTNDKIKIMYGNARAKRTYIYTEKGNFHGKFYNSFDPIDENAYNKKKSDALKEGEDKKLEKPEHRLVILYRKRLGKIFRELKAKGVKEKDISTICGMDYHSYLGFRREIELKEGGVPFLGSLENPELTTPTEDENA